MNPKLQKILRESRMTGVFLIMLLLLAWQVFRERRPVERACRNLFAFSILYLFLLFAVLLVDRGWGGLIARIAARGSSTRPSRVWPSSISSPWCPEKSRCVGRGVSAKAARQAWRISRGSRTMHRIG